MKTKRKTKQPTQSECPNCGHAIERALLERTQTLYYTLVWTEHGWSKPKADGIDFVGDALFCDHCEADEPLEDSWPNLGFDKLPTSDIQRFAE